MGLVGALMVRVLQTETLKIDSEVNLPACLDDENEECDDDYRLWALEHAIELLLGYTASKGVVAVIGLVEFITMDVLLPIAKGKPHGSRTQKAHGPFVQSQLFCYVCNPNWDFSVWAHNCRRSCSILQLCVCSG